MICNYVTGHCERGCSLGWTGYRCEKECEDGTFGLECTNKCSGHCLDDSPCNKKTGVCDRGCSPGYINSNCGAECSTGYFGMNCSKNCSGHCGNNESCDHVTGVCFNGCQDGYIGARCDEKCVWSFGENCQYPCGGYCIDQKCDRFNGSCLYGNCTLEARQRGRLAGFSLSVSNIDVSTNTDIKSATTCYKDGPHLPAINFTTTCIKEGRYVIFYNERLNEVTYPGGYELSNDFTELCEVIVKGRNTTCIYGSNCDIPCPASCKDNICQEQNGNCYDCKPGWLGSFCNTTCGTGWYGVNCSQPCVGHCRDGITCNHVTGLCDRGCNAGWTGYMCNKECNRGTFGYDCVNTCHCLNISSCDKRTGTCDGGCTPGYINNNCSTTCIDGYYGPDCSKKCQSNCRTCRHTDGMCTCGAGWIGPKCNTECVWSFGEDCQYPCNRHCLNQTCDRFNGSCLYGFSDEYMFCELARELSDK
uniref:Multiple epidermal growth factor-like domains 10 n=1 Tax=Magallana gigas TaxID=29159 RepID=K1QTK7_MAGGI